MVSRWLFILITCLFFTKASTNSTYQKEKFILITVLYNEKNDDRIKEYIQCLENNLTHPMIDLIHIVYDTSKDSHIRENKLLNYLKKKNIVLSYINNRPTYGFCFQLANQQYGNKKIILSNADIYFNQTLHLLDNYDLTNKFLALTRWNVQSDGKIKLHGGPHGFRFSQDVWIFQTPLKKFENDIIHIGTQHCDGKIAYQAAKAKLQVINPCYSIQCCHLHLSGIRDYETGPYPKNIALIVPATSL